MSIPQHAERILAAWNVADPEKFETELQSARSSCRSNKSRNFFEIEQQELLESVLDRFSGNLPAAGAGKRRSSAQGLSAGFALLQHLSHRAAA